MTNKKLLNQKNGNGLNNDVLGPIQSPLDPVINTTREKTLNDKEKESAKHLEGAMTSTSLHQNEPSLWNLKEAASKFLNTFKEWEKGWQDLKLQELLFLLILAQKI